MIWYTADLHLGHNNIIKYCKRPYLSNDDLAYCKSTNKWEDLEDIRISDKAIEAMDSDIIDSINRYVDVDDTLKIIGDFCSWFPRKKYVDRVVSYLDRISCNRVELIYGNHDLIDEIEAFSLFNIHGHTDLIKVEEHSIFSFHYPCLAYPESHHGGIHCHGHMHAEIADWCREVIPDWRGIDVGVDHAYKLYNEFRPFSLHEIVTETCKNLGMSFGGRVPQLGPRRS